MKDTNAEKAMELAKKHMPFCGIPITECIDAVLEMAEAKDLAFKRFLVEHISTDAVVETNEDGEPLAESFIAAGEARLKAAEEVFNDYKRFEETML